MGGCFNQSNRYKSIQKVMIKKSYLKIKQKLKIFLIAIGNKRYLEKIVIIPPLNNFYDVVKFMKKVDEITNDNVILVVNFFSKSWLNI